MKTTLSILVILFLLSCSTPDTQKEVEAIKQAIEMETAAFYKLDRSGWENSWVQTPYAYWSYSDSTGTSFIEGWENINNYYDNYLKTGVANRNIDVAHPEDELTIERNWKEIRVYGDGAYAQYTQRVKDKQIEREETSQIRVMEKRDGKWMVAYVGIIAKYPQD